MIWYANLRTSVKLVSSFLIVILLMIVVGGTGMMTMNKIGTSLDNVFSNDLKPIETLAQVREDVSKVKADIRGAELSAHANNQNTFVSEANKDMADAKAQWTTYQGYTVDNAIQQASANVATDLRGYEATLGQVEADLGAGRVAAARTMTLSTLEAQSTTVHNVLSQLTSLNDAHAKRADSQAHALQNTSRIILIGIMALAVIIALTLAIVISRLIAGPLQAMVELVGKVAQGDLRETTDITTKDEVGQLGRSVNKMVEQLREIMTGILEASNNVAAASEEISAATEQIASGSTTQAESSDTVNQLFNELATAIREVAQNAEQASQLSARTTEVAKKGESIVQSSVAGMNRVSEQIVRLSEDSNRVGEIVGVIDDIADQTNLLALNAAIEAARAGDQGRGFAVVADEVRKLAERSSDATKQITDIIKTMQANTETSVRAVQEGAASTQESGAAFSEIASVVAASADKVTEIAAASEEQSAQTSEVLVAIETIASAAEESAASSEETASSAQSLAQLAEELNGYVSVFRIN